MFPFNRNMVWIVVFVLVGTAGLVVVEDSESAALFTRRIEPLFREKCLACHGEDKETEENGLDLWSLQTATHGGRSNAERTIGATDEPGISAVEDVHHIRDFHVTVLRLLDFDDNKLTYYHAGRFKQLSQFGGKVTNKLFAEYCLSFAMTSAEGTMVLRCHVFKI